MTLMNAQPSSSDANRGKKLGLHKETLRVLRANASQNAAEWPCGDTCAESLVSDGCEPSWDCDPTGTG